MPKEDITIPPIVNEGDCIKVTPKTWIDKKIWGEINDILKLHEFSWAISWKG